MAAASSSKRPRLGHARDLIVDGLHVGGVSLVGLQSLLSRLGTNVSANSVKSVNHEVFERYSIKEELVLVDGQTFEWQYVDPATWLASMVGRSPVLQDMFASAWQRSPSSSERPWRLVLGFDEFSPGNKLQVQNRRKCMVLSFSFLELGQEALSSGRGWFTCVVLRSTVIAKIAGGWGCCLRRFLERQLLGPNGLAASGCPMTIGGRDILLFGKVSNLLSDGDGLRQALDWKGASSLKPCFKHFNVYKKAFVCTDRVTTFASSLPANVHRVTSCLTVGIVVHLVSHGSLIRSAVKANWAGLPAWQAAQVDRLPTCIRKC